MYTASLSLYYLLVIKYNISDIHIAKKYEIWMHIISIVYPLVGSIVSVFKELFNPTPWGCRIAEYPPKCDFDDYVPCIRGSNINLYIWLLSGIGLNISLGIITFSMGSIIYFVKKREHIMNRRLSFSNNAVCQSRHMIKQSKEVMIQGLFYVCSFILVWIFSSAYTLSRTKPNFLIVLSQLFWPLQGFLNSLIYFWPRYNKSRDEFKDQSFCWLVKDMIFTTTHEKEQRRAVLQSIRRRRSGIMTLTSKRRESAFSLKDEKASNSGNSNSISSDITSFAVHVGSDDVIDELSSSASDDIDGGHLVNLQNVRAKSEKEPQGDSSDECEDEFDDIMKGIL